MGDIKRVYLVDDDEINNFICVNIIQKIGFAQRVDSFEKGRDALDFLEKTAAQTPNELPEIIFLDINMPIMNGWDFLEEYSELKAKYNLNIDLYMLSSSIYQADVDKSKSYGDVVDFVTKPLREESLNAIKEKFFKEA
ncbi:MAG: response regulator [Bacteroidetes bacterium]|nr:response regulator [Bacteroidota bacterium]